MLGTKDGKSKKRLVPWISAQGGLDSAPRAGKSLEPHEHICILATERGMLG